MGNSKSSLLPPEPIKGNANAQEMRGVNSFPEANAMPLQYVSVPQPSDAVEPNHGTSDSQKDILYFTQPKYGSTPQENFNPPVLNSRKALNYKPTAWRAIAWVGLGLVSLLLLTILIFASLTVGIAGALVATTLACIPFAIIFLCISWVGKWDPEPFGLRVASFLWGGGISIALTFLITFLYGLIFTNPTSMFGLAAIQAPFVEEFAKGLGVLSIAFFLRKRFDGPVDGIVYMATIASGFAFTENVLYFSKSLIEGGIGGLTTTFFLRAVLSPFAHVIFSLPMGILAGIAIKRGYGAKGILGMWGIGYIPAVLLHGLWNGSSTLIAGELWFVFYGLIQIPIFLGAVFAVEWFRKNEAYSTYKRLTEYGWAGWFTPLEVESFATWDGRKNSVKWAKRHSLQSGDIMKNITKDVVVLSNVREKIIRGKSTPEILKHEEELLNRITSNKNFLLTL